MLKRAEVLSLRRLRSDNLVFNGPFGDAGWNLPSNSRLNIKPGGVLTMPYWNRSASMDITLPESVEVDLNASSTMRPDFRIILRGAEKRRLAVETWDNEIVLTAGPEFKAVRKMAPEERAVALRLFWNQKSGKCSVFTSAGKSIVEWPVPEDDEKTSAALSLQNEGHDLSIEALRIRAWDGKPPAEVDETRPRVELSDGRIIEGVASSGSAAGSLHIGGNSNNGPDLPLKDVEAVVFSTEPPASGEHEASLSFADGTLVLGRIASIKDGWASMATSFTEKPLGSSLDALRQLIVHVPVPPKATAGASGALAPPAGTDKISIKGNTLHGTLIGSGGNEPRWLPVGGVTSASPSKAFESEITRALPANAELPSAPALFYTTAGDVLPGVLAGIDHTGVDFDSPLVEAKKLAGSSLNAVLFRAGSSGLLRGFAGTGWRILKGDDKSVQKTEDELHLSPGTSVGHPQAMQSSEIKFKIVGGNFSTLRLRMFCAGTDSSSPSTNMILSMMGDRFCSGVETSEGQLDNQIQTRVASGTVAVRIVIKEQLVELYVDDVLTQTLSVPTAKRFGSGLVLEPAGLWGNQVMGVSLSGFSATPVPGGAPLPYVDAQAKIQALTVPRFRKDDPPLHALIAGNGDVLRGEIEAATATHLAFRSGLEDLTVPLDRVRAVIWLKKPGESVPKPPEESALRKQLDQRIARRMRFGKASLKNLADFLHGELPDVTFKVPDKEDPRRFPMWFGGQTAGDALDQVCRMFGLSYRLEGSDTIVLEAASEVAKDLVRRVYWLKAGAFPGTQTAQDILTAKGVSFPPKTSARWDAEACELTMTNTAENQGKLGQVLATDFGGSLGSPTHWLLLTNGARLGLAVDKFDNDTITGHHPLYGRCTVAMSDVYVIRTTPGEPSAAMRMVQDWHLVFAPEPVLPTTGGESSALLGTQAKGFKLPLLGGGFFDLSEEKGNVVVLDFWATWCGPCIRSLPGLIESMAALPADRVKFVGVNQGEPAAQVKRFLDTRGWKLTVAMDESQSVGRQYGAEAIPHTVIVGRDGKIAWVKTGFTPDGETEAAEEVKKITRRACRSSDCFPTMKVAKMDAKHSLLGQFDYPSRPFRGA